MTALGVNVDYNFPTFTSKVNRGLLLEAAPVFAADHRLSAVPRLVVAMFVRDRDDLLLSLLNTLHEPFESEIDHPLKFVSFSIDGAITSRVGANWLMIFVISPLSRESKKFPALEILRKALLAELFRRFGHLGGVDPSGDEPIRVLDFQPRESDIFASTRLVEYRLETQDREPSRLGSLARAVGLISRDAGEAQIAVAYVHFPSWEGDSTSGFVARIGCAVPKRNLEHARGIVHLDSAAIRAAVTMDLRLDKYSHPGSSSDSPYREIGDYRETAPDSDATDTGGLSRAIFVIGKARTGFVGQMLDEKIADKLEGGVMTVVGGHTIAGWVCSDAESEAVVKHFDSLDMPETQIVHQMVNTGATSPRTSEFHVWLKWNVPDTPGVFYESVRSLQQLARECLGPSVRVDVDYSVSRVVEGNACVGKLRAGLVGLSETLDEDKISELNASLTESAFSKRLREAYPSSSAFQLAIQSEEPVESPWALLVPIIARR